MHNNTATGYNTDAACASSPLHLTDPRFAATMSTAAAQANGHRASTSTDSPIVASASSTQTASKISPSDVGWQFVPQY